MTMPYEIAKPLVEKQTCPLSWCIYSMPHTHAVQQYSTNANPGKP